jgi:HEPN domain-containing protein
MAKADFDGRSEQSKAGKHRREDAQVLFEHRRWRGAMYLGGYALECLLKVRLMERFGCDSLAQLEPLLIRRGLLSATQTIYTHRLERLLQAAQAQDRIQASPADWGNFVIVNQWVEAWRYNPSLATESEAAEFLDALDLVLRWIESNV